jgi:hypothetical protein
MVQPTNGQVFNVIDLEREIESEVRNRPPVRDPRPLTYAPARLRAPLPTAEPLEIPDYVQHRDGATEIGKLSAEAVVREYEAAAKDIEAMGAELVDRVKQCEAMTRDAMVATDEMKETARRYREEARRIFLQIEDCSLMTAEVRKTCLELKEKIAGPSPATAPS